MGRFVIVAYTPKPDQERALMEAVRDHVRILSEQNLVTDRPAYVMQAGDGTIVEVFEWRSADAIAQAHTNPEVQALWERFGVACEYRSLASLTECQQLFAEFEALPL